MEGLSSFLLFALLFYVMMRYGCGAHMIHGHHDSHDHRNAHDAQFIDPVCGKEVNQNEGYGVMHESSLYRFCSRKCLDQFDDQPSFFIHKQEKGADHEH